MTFIKPALASPWPGTLPKGAWVAEEKLDGIRVIVEVSEPMPMTDTPVVFCWSRNAKDRLLPPHILEPLRALPVGVYDGELIAGRGLHSYDVANLDNRKALKLALFDVLTTMGVDLTELGTLPTAYEDRRQHLVDLGLDKVEDGAIVMPFMEPITTDEEVWALAGAVWDLDGEGLILKSTRSLYQPGKRSKAWIKIKQQNTAVLTLIGFKEGLMGPRSIAELQDADGNVVSVKWKNLLWLEQACDAWVGRAVRIDFHERTPDGSYRHPMWDRFEEER